MEADNFLAGKRKGNAFQPFGIAGKRPLVTIENGSRVASSTEVNAHPKGCHRHCTGRHAVEQEMSGLQPLSANHSSELTPYH